MPCRCPPDSENLAHRGVGARIEQVFGDSHILEVSCNSCVRVIDGESFPQTWLEHNIAAGGRALITADWEKTGWNMFVFSQGRQPGQYPILPPNVEPSISPPVGDELHSTVQSGYYLPVVSRFFFREDWFTQALIDHDVGFDLVIETAHFRRRTETSKAQVYTLPQLDELYQLTMNSGGKLRIFEFPAAMQKRVHIECGTDPKNDKERDPENIANFILNRREVVLRRFNPATWRSESEGRNPSEEREARTKLRLREITKDANYRLNVLRASDPPYVLPEETEGLNLERYFGEVNHAIELIESGLEALSATHRSLLSQNLNIKYFPSEGDLRDLCVGHEESSISLAGARRLVEEHNIPEGGVLDLATHGFDRLTAQGNFSSQVTIRVPFAEESVVSKVAQRAGIGRVEVYDRFEAWESRMQRLGLNVPAQNGSISRTDGFPKLNSIMAVYVLVIEYDDQDRPRLRRNPDTQQFIGVDFIWSRLLTMSPFHGIFGGVPRANLMMYGLQATHEPGRNSVRYQRIDNALDRFDRMYDRQLTRREWRKSVKILIRLFRDAMIAEESSTMT